MRPRLMHKVLVHILTKTRAAQMGQPSSYKRHKHMSHVPSKLSGHLHKH